MNLETGSEQELWQVEAGGSTYDASFEDMRAWIAEGSLLRIDRVRKGNLRWIEAGKVPSLLEFFNAKDASSPTGPVVTTTSTEVLGVAETMSDFANSAMPAPNPDLSHCSVHTDAAVAYLCDTCSNAFCKACPASYGSTVKICPFCGAMCKSIHQEQKIRNQAKRTTDSKPFGFADFSKALAHPFKFKASLIIGALMFAFASFGQSGVAFGGIFMLVAAIFCFMLANTLTFGILANTVENFSQGKLDEDFMPSFDDFSLWEDVVHPFFLSIAAYISSFGPFLIVIAIGLYMIIGAVSDEGAGGEDAPKIATPQLSYAETAANQTQRVQEILQKNRDEQSRRVEEIDAGNVPTEERTAVAMADQLNDDTEKMVAEANKLIDQHRKAQLEATVGKSPETLAKERSDLISGLFGYGSLFILVAGVTLIWGLFYFPAACAVAGYTRSFAATLNPLVGLDTIRRLGLDYVKILIMALVIAISSGVIGALLNTVFSAFELPGFGNLPATVVGSLFTFYFSVVFSCIIGYALFKAADRLELYSG